MKVYYNYCFFFEIERKKENYSGLPITGAVPFKKRLVFEYSALISNPLEKGNFRIFDPLVGTPGLYKFIKSLI